VVTALDALGVRASLDRERSWGLALLAGGLASLALFGMGLHLLERRSDVFDRNAARYPGVVVYVVEATSRSGGDRITVEWTEDGQVRRFEVGVGDASVYGVGRAIDVLVDPVDTSVVTVPGELDPPWYVGPILVVALVAGIVIAPCATVCLVRIRRQRRLLGSARWSLGSAAVAPVFRQKSTIWFMRFDGAAEDAVLRIKTGRIWGQATELLEALEHVEFVGDPTQRVVVRVPAGQLTWIAHRPRFALGRRGARSALRHAVRPAKPRRRRWLLRGP
jgi:hypothetical protein